ncbi:MAG: hypothetical protein CME70_01935 [Halobacteriovorax sp.]|nr:hypothetical protein [Halobacteriovorax sp.]|tara:strand:+ start:45504 stop:46610 length:1107 start_codon:yes stop_codon:yes gene_type:complete
MSELRPEKNYIPSLDGLRAISIILVIFYHANLFLGSAFEKTFTFEILNSGNIGVSCFFVLSGFLITRILLNTRDHPSYYKIFFFRRLLRIFPLYYLILIIAFVILPQFDHPRLDKWSGTDPTLYWFYLSNFYIASVGKFNHGLVDLSWSLSIEEQFYFVWPWLVLWINPKRLKIACYLGILISILSRIYFGYKGNSEIQVYVLTYCRLDGLLMGSLLALEDKSFLSFSKIKRFRSLIMLGSFLFACLFKFTILKDSLFNMAVSYFCIALFFSCVLSDVLEKNYSFFSNSILISLGKYSYGIYLIHFPVQAALREVFFKSLVQESSYIGLMFYQLLFVLIVTAVSYILSFFVFHLYEKRFLKLKRYFSY